MTNLLSVPFRSDRVMTEPMQPQPIYKCDFCPCIFCTEKDLFLHMEAFGVEGVQHLEKWKRTHANLEGHYGGEE